MKKIALFSLLFFIVSACYADDMELCFYTSSIKVHLHLAGDEWKTGTSQYCGQKKSMELVQIKYITVKSFKDRPSIFHIQWKELNNKRVTGYYSVLLQGANFYNAYFYNNKTKKRTVFEVNTIQSATDCACKN